ncbi:MAG: HNH endonuclease [Actinomycetes bacterium]
MLFLFVSAVRTVHAVVYPGNHRDPVRRFSRQDKMIIVSRAGGRCEHHGWLTGRCKRTEGLEADHVHPHSRGGQTAVANGQALCRPHNQAKRANIPFNWQLRAIERRRATYFPSGVPGMVTRRAGRTRPSRRPASGAPLSPQRDRRSRYSV